MITRSGSVFCAICIVTGAACLLMVSTLVMEFVVVSLSLSLAESIGEDEAEDEDGEQS